MIGSFFITEKLSPAELNKLAELSEDELKKIINRGLTDAKVQIEDAIDAQVEASSGKVERALEKETNEKIMAISEYSDTVIENMNKTHNEIMFLYSMLNDKHTELTGLASDLQRLAADVRNIQETMTTAKTVTAPVERTVNIKQVSAEMTERPQLVHNVEETEPESIEQALEASVAEEEEKENHNKDILILHKEGLSDIEIARKFGLGLGEVKLVIGLYKGDIDS